MKRLLFTLFLLSTIIDRLPAVSTIIDSGSPSDSNFTGGLANTFPAISDPDKTFRSGSSFSYTIQANEGIPYVLNLTFIEPCFPGAGCGTPVTAAGQRVFSVTVNDQLLIPRMDIFAAAGAGVSIKRSLVVMPSNFGFVISFTGILKTAVVSSMELVPFFELYGTPGQGFPVGSLADRPADQPSEAGKDCQPGDWSAPDSFSAPPSSTSGGGLGAPLYLCIAGKFRRFRADPEPWGTPQVADLGGVLQAQEDTANPTSVPVYWFRDSMGLMYGPFTFSGPGPIPSGLKFPVLIQPVPRPPQ